MNIEDIEHRAKFSNLNAFLKKNTQSIKDKENYNYNLIGNKTHASPISAYIALRKMGVNQGSFRFVEENGRFSIYQVTKIDKRKFEELETLGEKISFIKAELFKGDKDEAARKMIRIRRNIFDWEDDLDDGKITMKEIDKILLSFLEESV